jgi:hypothetical protein
VRDFRTARRRNEGRPVGSSVADRRLTLDVRSCERFVDEPVGGVWASDDFGVVAFYAQGRTTVEDGLDPWGLLCCAGRP